MAKRKNGKRDKSGKLLRPTTRAGRETREQPNIRVIERMERFSHKSILDGKAAHDTFDGPGQLHAMGYFHGKAHEPDVIRDILREYAEHYWCYYACMNADTQEYDRQPRSEPNTRRTPTERRFQDLDAFLPMVSAERQAMHRMVINYWGSDRVAPEVEGLVNDGMQLRKLPVAGFLSSAEDRWMFDALLRAAYQLIEMSLTPRCCEMMKKAA